MVETKNAFLKKMAKFAFLRLNQYQAEALQMNKTRPNGHSAVIDTHNNVCFQNSE